MTMTPPGEQFPFVQRDPALGAMSLMAVLPLRLHLGGKSADTAALVDTGAAVNVLPHFVGLQLGAVWENQSTIFSLGGALRGVEGRDLLLTASVGSFPAVQLIFAWAKVDNVPLVLGQYNFFKAFDVCFFRSRSLFEVRPRA